MCRSRKKDVCHHSGDALYEGEDDQPETIRVRMSACQESTLPLIQYYRQQGLLISIKADEAPLAIFQRTVAAFNGAAAVSKEQEP
jgi:adenylate kinase